MHYTLLENYMGKNALETLMGPDGTGLGNTSLNFDDDIACELHIMPTQHARHNCAHTKTFFNANA